MQLPLPTLLLVVLGQVVWTVLLYYCVRLSAYSPCGRRGGPRRALSRRSSRRAMDMDMLKDLGSESGIMLGDDETDGGASDGGEESAAAEATTMEGAMPDLQCNGCAVKTTGDCEIQKKKDPSISKRVVWARYSKKKVMVRGKKTKVRVPTGCWCRTCFNYWRTHCKSWIPKLDTFTPQVWNKQDKRKKWVKGRSEYVHQKAGGTSRVRGPKKTIKKTTKVRTRLAAEPEKFWTLEAYVKKYGDPAANGATVEEATHPVTGKVCKGVYVKEGIDGVFTVNRERITDSALEKDVTAEVTGSDGLIVDENEVDNEFDQMVQDEGAGIKQALSAEETLQRKQLAESRALAAVSKTKAEAAAEAARKEESDDDGDGSSSSSGESSESGMSDDEERKDKGDDDDGEGDCEAKAGGRSNKRSAPPCRIFGSLN